MVVVEGLVVASGVDGVPDLRPRCVWVNLAALGMRLLTGDRLVVLDDLSAAEGPQRPGSPDDPGR
ncbi:hypothetical protein [Amycolatopsis anabasis]|uniref:hypothetical protein n=1 Tax=Amycolatopsis anabasis TaxID=1840409 RepID=UPI00131DE04C|nr:hypothetical protein [Amycolatopsis anabasis]